MKVVRVKHIDYKGNPISKSFYFKTKDDVSVGQLVECDTVNGVVLGIVRSVISNLEEAITDNGFTSPTKECRIYAEEWVKGPKDLQTDVNGLTEAEKQILLSIDRKYNYIARDEDGDLWLYANTPMKGTYNWLDDSNCNGAADISMFSHLFECIQWSDVVPCPIDSLVNRRGK